MDTYEAKAKILDEVLIKTLIERSIGILAEFEKCRQDYVTRFIAEFVDDFTVDGLVQVLKIMDVEHKKSVAEMAERLEKRDDEILEKSQKIDLLFKMSTTSSVTVDMLLASKKLIIDHCLADKSSEFSTELVNIRHRNLRMMSLM